MDETDSLNDLKIPSFDIEPHILISSVRKHYLKYIVEMLSQNYVGWCGEQPPDELLGAALHFELRAAAQAMVVPLYRKAMSNLIQSLKEHTKKSDVYPDFREYCIISQSCHKVTQTDLNEYLNSQRDIISTTQISPKTTCAVDEYSYNNYDNISNENESSLHDNLTSILPSDDLKEKNNLESILNGAKNNEGILQSDPDTDKNIQDDVTKEMEMLFGGNSREGDIFDDSITDRQIQLIMEEIKCFGRKDSIGSIESPNTSQVQRYDNVNENNPLFVNDNAVDSPRVTRPPLTERLSDLVNNDIAIQPVTCGVVSSSQPPPVSSVYSVWPCEHYYQKKMLREALDGISDRSFKLRKKVDQRFIELFSSDSDDEQALQSPDTSPEFQRSCRQRVAPWMARHLQPYLKRTRMPLHLSRPLARHLLYLLTQFNQYPDDFEVYFFVKSYFKEHPKIRCQADF